MKNKTIQLLVLISASFIIDIVYYLGYRNLIDIFIDHAIIWFIIALAGFIFSYITLNNSEIKHKVIFYIITTIGVLINLGFLFLWYILKDFGF